MQPEGAPGVLRPLATTDLIERVKCNTTVLQDARSSLLYVPLILYLRRSR